MIRPFVRHTVAAIVICALLGGFAVWVVWLVPRWHLFAATERAIGVGVCVIAVCIGVAAHEWGRS